MSGLDPIPVVDPIADPSRMLTANWYRWLSAFVNRALFAVIKTANNVHRTGVSVSIAATTLFVPDEPGDYRVNWYAQVTTPGTVSSSLTVTIGWKANGIACTKSFTAMTGNTTSTCDGDSVTIRPDSGQAVTYATTYATVGATPMVYQVDVTAEALP